MGVDRPSGSTLEQVRTHLVFNGELPILQNWQNDISLKKVGLARSLSKYSIQ
jgi:hypothetical protein